MRPVLFVVRQEKTANKEQVGSSNSQAPQLDQGLEFVHDASLGINNSIECMRRSTQFDSRLHRLVNRMAKHLAYLVKNYEHKYTLLLYTCTHPKLFCTYANGKKLCFWPGCECLAGFLRRDSCITKTTPPPEFGVGRHGWIIGIWCWYFQEHNMFHYIVRTTLYIDSVPRSHL